MVMMHQKMNSYIDDFSEKDRGNLNYIYEISGYSWLETISHSNDNVFKIGNDVEKGLEYYLELTTYRDNKKWNYYNLVNNPNDPNGDLSIPPIPESGWYRWFPEFNIKSDKLLDGWISWKVKARAIGDPTCECEYSNGIVDFENNEEQDLCYSAVYPAGMLIGQNKGIFDYINWWNG